MKMKEFMKEKREVLLYIFFGGLSFVISISSYAYFDIVIGWNELVANIISWILAVSFSYITNRIWVFEFKATTPKGIWREVVSFFTGRIATLILEELILCVFISILGLNSMVVKSIAQIIVIVSNYIISKLVIFKER